MPPETTQPDKITAMSTAEVLRKETEELWGEAKAAEIWDAAGPPDDAATFERYGRAMLDNGQAALCLSGGGIRSAAFALGVVQALSRKNLLPCFHYLSTVSGGGYFGGFLSRWIQEQRQDPAIVQNLLAGRTRSGAAEPGPIRWLRENSNFITPRIGLASADTWTAIAVSVRNVLINWLVFAPALLIVAAIPNLAASLLVVSDGLFADFCLIAGTLLIGFATYQGAFDLPSHLGPDGKRRDGGFVFKRIVWPAMAGSAAIAAGVSHDLIGVGSRGIEHPLIGAWHFRGFDVLTPNMLVAQALTLASASLIIGLLGGYVVAAFATSRLANATLRKSNLTGFGRNLHIWLIGTMVGTLFYAWGLSFISRVPCPLEGSGCGRRIDALATAAIILGTFAQLILTTVFVAFRWVPEDQRISPELDREWLARVSAQKLRIALAWTLFAAATLLPWHLLSWPLGEPPTEPAAILRRENLERTWQWLVGLTGALSSIIAALGGQAAATGHRTDPGSGRKLVTSDVLVGIATFIAIVLLTMFLGRIEFRLAEWLSGWLGFAGSWALVLGHLVALGAIGFMLYFTSQTVNVNRFSLNGMYRNRLARAFLGAARERRDDAEPFTGFAPSDNIRLQALKAVHPTTGRRVLMPVVNVALNLVGGPRLAWQERKAQAFIFTPIASGSAALAEDPKTGQCAGHYIDSGTYAGSEPDLGLPGTGVSLATTIAISGAAASPSMGYHSSPATAFLMTLFNVRLGAWLPNPGRDDLPRQDLMSSAPNNALRPLLRELLGFTDARGHSVYLSDGGHFENLGLYEMVRRRCRYIVVSDAGCDPNSTFEDLGNALRKIRIDLGVNITVETVNIASREKWQRNTSTFFALGTIHYPEGDGELLYIKPVCHHSLPADVRAYALASKSFPHESTADQWFSESQFESYRSLGASLVDRLGTEDAEHPKSYAECSLAEFFKDIRRQVEVERTADEGSKKSSDGFLESLVTALKHAELPERVEGVALKVGDEAAAKSPL